MKLASHIALWVSAIALCALITPIFLPAERFDERSSHDLAVMTALFGRDRATTARSNASHWAQAFLDASVAAGINITGRPDSRVKEAEALPDGFRGVVNATDGYAGALLENIHGAFLRIAIVLAWMPYSLPFMAAAFCDGIVVRKVRREVLRVPSPALYSLGTHLGVALAFSPAVLFLSPVPYLAWLVPIWVLGGAAALWLAAGNTA